MHGGATGMALLEPDVGGEGAAALQCSCTRASATPESSGALSVYRDVQNRSKGSPCSCHRPVTRPERGQVLE